MMMLRLCSLFLSFLACTSYSPSQPSRALQMHPRPASSSLIVPNQDESSVSTRRSFLSSSSAGAFLGMGSMVLSPFGASAEDDLVEYQDATWKFAVKVPSGWEKSIQSLPDRRKIDLYIKPGSNQKTLMFIAYTPVRADFTSLGSFGSVDEVGQATILPKQEIAGVTDVSSKMLNAESKKQSYFFDYLTKVPQQPETHFRTIFTLASGAGDAAGSTLVTITVQTPESDYGSVKPLFDKVMDSFQYVK